MKNLSTEQPIDKHLKPVKDSDNNTSALEISTEKVRVKDLEVTGTTTGISASDDTKLPLSGGTMTGDITLPTDGKIIFDDADEYIKGDGTDLIISSTSNVDFNDSRLTNIARLSFNDGGSTIDIVRDEDDMTSNDASALATQQSVKAYVDTNRRWSIQTGGYRSNNNSSTIYYFQYRPNGEIWSNTDSSPTTLSVYDSYASMLVAPYDGKVTKISVHGYASDTGAGDPIKFYVFKGTPSDGGTNLGLQQIGVTGTINPVSTRQFVENTDISSSNTFSQHDAIFVMYKKDSTSGNQDLYFSITVSGEYTS